MERNAQQIVRLLPQQYPFRFVDHVSQYRKGKSMKAVFNPLPLYPYLGQGDTLPVSVLVEGLAQVAVLFTQLETRPLESYEMPLLGKIKVNVTGTAGWNRQLVYELSPVRILSNQAIFSGVVKYGHDLPILSATLGVAVAVKGSVLS